MLRVTMSQSGSYYLRGFVGEVYDGSRWLPQTNATLSANADTFYWLHHDGFYGQAQIVGAAQSAAPEVLHGENRITVTNAAASSRYLYAPYETMPTSPTLDAAAIGDAAQYAPGAARSAELHRPRGEQHHRSVPEDRRRPHLGRGAALRLPANGGCL